MPKRSRTPKDPVKNALRVVEEAKDPVKNALRVVEEAIGEPIHPKPRKPRKNPHAVALGRKGGLRGGVERAKKLSPEKRSEIAKIAASARWKK